MTISGDPVESRLLEEYGAVFLARGVKPPEKVVFHDQAEVLGFQSTLDIGSAEVGGIMIELQSRALQDLLCASEAAKAEGLTITPRGTDSARRDYDQTVSLWLSRVEPGLRYWTTMGRIGLDEAERISELCPFDQVSEILALEAEGVYFAKDLSKSIVYSVAPPGTSQHLSLLAFDVAEFEDANVRRILADHRWYQTVISDLPHFTYLGRPEKDLPGAGLKKVDSSGRSFWVPDI